MASTVSEKPLSAAKPKTHREVDEEQNGWVSRTTNIGAELALPSIKRKLEQKKKISQIEQDHMAKGNQYILKEVLRKGYWKYKPEHFFRAQRAVEERKNPETHDSPIKGFLQEIDATISLTKYKSPLEIKYQHTDRFKFSESELERYESVKQEREAQRLQRRAQQEAEIREQNAQLEKEREEQRKLMLEKDRQIEEQKKAKQESLRQSRDKTIGSPSNKKE